MLFGGAQDKRELFTRRASAEQEGHDERMWKPNLGSVHDTIAETLPMATASQNQRSQKRKQSAYFARNVCADDDGVRLTLRIVNRSWYAGLSAICVRLF